jgi:hypothetical protein
MKNIKPNSDLLHLAININGGLEPIGYGYEGINIEFENPQPVYIKGNFKAAYKAATEQVNEWGWGYDEILIYVIAGQQLTKKEFKERLSGYRMYLATNDPEKVALMEKYNPVYVERYGKLESRPE